MREIKFRAWDVEEECWIPQKHFAVSAFGELATRDDMQEYPHNYIPEIITFILMQYTGLKDKNGVEIYEGDICIDNYKRVMQIKWRQCTASYVWEVVSSNREPRGRIMMIDSWFYDGEPLPKVIGNIYENPELLESK